MSGSGSVTYLQAGSKYATKKHFQIRKTASIPLSSILSLKHSEKSLDACVRSFLPLGTHMTWISTVLPVAYMLNYILRKIGGSNERIFQGWTLDCPLQVVHYALFLSGNDGLLKRGTPEHVAHRGR